MVRALIVGAGVTGSTVAHVLARAGAESVVLEGQDAPGGLIRSATMNGVLYEPHGSHIFHTDERWIWDFVTGLVPFNDYRHRVDILAAGGVYNWPLRGSDIARQPDSAQISAELRDRRGVGASERDGTAGERGHTAHERDGAENFEDWCLGLTGPTLYERFIRPYTQKQWGRDPRELSSSWAPRRISIRWDENPYLFRDRFQGWPAGGAGYTDLIDALLAHGLIELRVASPVRLPDLPRLVREHACDAVVLTCPLDQLCQDSLGALPWRGILVRSVFVPHVELAQSAMVVNYPGLEFPFIRVHETKHASRQTGPGTVLGFEFTGAPARHYPVEDPASRTLNERYRQVVREALAATPAYFGGRLATYRYLNIDECIAEAHAVASSLLAGL
jgi:UDP-galactopyranose mutase